MVYAAGNFVESTRVSPYFQIGESKYGKPIIDRVITPATPLDEVAKCALISMDSTLRSNLSVGLPLDLLVYEKDSLSVTRFASLDNDSEYFQMIHRTWGERLRQIFGEIPNPTWTDSADVPRREREQNASVPRLVIGDLPCPEAPAQTLAQIEPGGVQQ
jgi:putative proteasome-type protease